jgi:hypothetical protein
MMAASALHAVAGDALAAARSEPVTATVEAYSGTPGCYRVWFTLSKVGCWRIRARYGHHELSTPHAPLTVEAGALCARQCQLVATHDPGAPPPSACAAGHVWRAKLLLRDAYGNAVSIGKHRLDGRFRPLPPPRGAAPHEAPKHVATAEDAAEAAAAATMAMWWSEPRRGKEPIVGAVDLSAKLKHAKTYVGAVYLDGTALPTVRVRVQPALPSADASAPLSDIDGAHVRVLSPTVFYIAARDACGNSCVAADGLCARITPAGAGEVVVRAPSGQAELNAVAQLGGDVRGTLALALTAHALDDLQLHVDVCGKALVGSPYNLMGLPGCASARQSYADLSPLPSPRAHVPMSVRLITRDGMGYGCEEGGAPLHATISPAGTRFGAVLGIADHLDGTYTVTLLCSISARYSLQVTIGGEAIHGSPYAFSVALEEHASVRDGSPRRRTPTDSRAEIGGDAADRGRTLSCATLDGPTSMAPLLPTAGSTPRLVRMAAPGGGGGFVGAEPRTRRAASPVGSHHIT